MRKLFDNKLLKVTSFNTFAVTIKIIGGIITSKTLAFFLGPQGIVYVGNLRDFIHTLHNVATLSLEKGLIKYSAEYKESKEKLRSFVTTLFCIVLPISLMISILLFFSSESLSVLLFDDKQYQYLFKIISFSVPFYVSHVYLLSIINGLGAFRQVLQINIFGYIINAVLMFVLTWQLLLKGALLTLIVTPLFLFFFTLFKMFSYYKPKIRLYIYKSDIKINHIKNLGGYVFMTLFSGIVFPLVYITIRNYAIDAIGAEQAGYWEAINRISSNYLLFVTSLLTLYLLPSLSSISSRAILHSTIYRFYKVILPVFGIGLILVYIFRKWIILVFLSEDFLPVSPLFKWQLLGDFFRVASLILVTQFHAKKMVYSYIFTDMLLALMIYFANIYFINVYGLEGMVIAYTITYISYFILTAIVFKKMSFKYSKEP
ncbi:O-antigen translocase [Leptobacterium sp. I13]|uniref:O-antigen translocase n=1 Tax=Leptobacterium meishanense TaxID=3128904 RepID=UPI0030EB61FD